MNEEGFKVAEEDELWHIRKKDLFDEIHEDNESETVTFHFFEYLFFLK